MGPALTSLSLTGGGCPFDWRHPLLPDRPASVLEQEFPSRGNFGSTDASVGG